MADTTAPRLTAFSLPASIDARMAQSYTFAVNATDDDSGVDRVSLLFDKVLMPGALGANRELLFLDSTESFGDGTSILTTNFSPRLGAGIYTVVGASVTDKAGNVARYDAAQIGALTDRSSFQVISNAVADTDLPVLKSLIIPGTISLQGRQVALTASASDATSGPAYVQVQFDKPLFVTDQTGRGGVLSSSIVIGQLRVGDDLSTRTGVGPDRFAQTAQVGTYTILKVTVGDVYGNQTTYDAAALGQLGIATTVTVNNDPLPPPLADVIGPATIREGSGSFDLTFTAPAGYGAISSGVNISVDASSIARNGTDVGILSTAYTTSDLQVRGSTDVATIRNLSILDDAVPESNETLVLRVQVPGYRFANGTDTKLVSIILTDNESNGGDLLWFQAGLRQFTTWQPEGAGFRYGSFTSAPLDSGVRPVGLHDFTGDGLSDVLLQTADGSAVSVMRGTVAGGYEQFGMTGAMAAGWRVAGVGDVTGDGRADILFRRGGELSVATPDGTTLKMNAIVEGSPSADWHIATVEDFNGDGRDDIYWRSENGTNALWYGTGTGFDRFGPQSAVDRGWHVEGSGDFNGDGRADLVWRNDNGAFVIWAAQAGGGFDRGFYGNAVGTEWSLEQVRDFSGDGRADLLWRTGGSELSLWQWAGSGFTSAIDPKGPSAASWSLPPLTLDFI